MLLKARVASFFRVIPVTFTGDYSGASPVTKEEQVLQRRIVSQVRRLAKRNSSDIGRSNFRGSHNLSWLYLPAMIKLRQPDGWPGLSLRYRSAMVIVAGPYFSLQVGQTGREVKTYLVSARRGKAYLTVHMVIHVFDYHRGAWVSLPERRPDPTTEFIEQDDLFRPDAKELTELYFALVAVD